MENMFLKEAANMVTFTENGARSYATTGSEIVDQFAKCGTAMHRDYLDVWADQSRLWADDEVAALKFPFYLRLITRKVKFNSKETESLQKGAGLKDEAFKRFLWLAKFHPEEFYRNLWLVPVVGSWKDIWSILAYDYEQNNKNTVNVDQFFEVLKEGIANIATKDLVAKYLPRIRSKSNLSRFSDRANVLNDLAKRFAKYCGWTYKQYREFKSSGKAHDFQQIICARRYDSINWNRIPGKALLQLISGKFLEKHNLVDTYLDWIKDKGILAFNGYPYELSHKINLNSNIATINTVNAQFNNLIEKARNDNKTGGINGNVLCALDTSGSMSSPVNGSHVTSYDVCVSMGIYFSELNTGAFHDVVAMFDSKSSLLTLKGTFFEKLNQIRRHSTAWGSTNFQSIIDLLVDTRAEHPEIPISDYPTTILVISDMQFNDCGEQTNYQTAVERISKVFPEEYAKSLKFIWWFCAGRKTSDFPSTIDHGGNYFFSGFDGSIINFLLNGEIDEKGNKKTPTMEEIIDTAMNQEILCLVQ